MAELVPLRGTLREKGGRKQALGEVVDTPVALPPGDREDTGLGERLQQRPHRVRRAPVPVDGGPGLMSVERQGPALADPREQLLHEGGVLVERPARVRDAPAVPGDPVPRQLGRGHEREHLVVRLVEDAIPIQEVLRPCSAVPGHPGEERQVVVPAGDLEGVELQRAEPVQDAHHGGGLRRERPRRSQKVAADQEAARGGARDVADGVDHIRDRRPAW